MPCKVSLAKLQAQAIVGDVHPRIFGTRAIIALITLRDERRLLMRQ